MRNVHSATLKLGLSAVAALALTVGAVTPAFAANYHVGPECVAPFEVGGDGTEADFNYDQWHIGSQTNTDASLDTSVTFDESSITTLTPSAPSTNTHVQVLKGFPVAQRVGFGADGTVDAFKNFLEGTTITVLQGSVTVQIPVFEYVPSGPDAGTHFYTFRSLGLEAGVHNLQDLSFTFSVDGLQTGIEYTYEELLALLEDYVDGTESSNTYEILGVGFNGSEGAAVESLTFGGDTYTFGVGECVLKEDGGGEVVVPPVVPPTPGTATPPQRIETAA